MPMEWIECATRKDPTDPSPPGQIRRPEAAGQLFLELDRVSGSGSKAADPIRFRPRLQISDQRHRCHPQARTLHHAPSPRPESKPLRMWIRKKAGQKFLLWSREEDHP